MATNAKYKVYDGTNWVEYHFTTNAAQVSQTVGTGFRKFVSASVKVNGVAFGEDSNNNATVTINGSHLNWFNGTKPTTNYLSSVDTVQAAISALDTAAKDAYNHGETVVSISSIPTGLSSRTSITSDLGQQLEGDNVVILHNGHYYRKSISKYTSTYNGVNASWTKYLYIAPSSTGLYVGINEDYIIIAEQNGAYSIFKEAGTNKAYSDTMFYSEIEQLVLYRIASKYSNTSTYNVGDYCWCQINSSQNRKFYRCTAAITTAENWNSSHWEEVKVLNELKAVKDGLGAAAAKGFTTSVTNGSADLVTSGAVYNAISDLSKAMIFRGTLGTGGTITALPTASASTEGDVYRVITAGTYADQAAIVGDMFVCGLPTGSSTYAWTLVPSGDDIEDTYRAIQVNGTQLLGNGNTTGAVNFKNGGNITVTGSGSDITLGVASGYSIPSDTKQSQWDAKGTYSKPSGGIPASDLASGVIPDVSGLVPYTGATEDVDLNGHGLKSATSANAPYAKYCLGNFASGNSYYGYLELYSYNSSKSKEMKLAITPTTVSGSIFGGSYWTIYLPQKNGTFALTSDIPVIQVGTSFSGTAASGNIWIDTN